MYVVTEVDEWIQKMQAELGQLGSQAMLFGVQRDRAKMEIEALTLKISQDAELIEALKERIFKADNDNKELKKQLRSIDRQWELFSDGTDTV